MPVLRCPDHEVQLAADGPARTVRHPAPVPRVAADRDWTRGSAQYEAAWDPAIDRVDLSQAGAGGRQVVLKAQAAAQAGATGAVTVKAKGGADSFKIKVRVISAPPIATLRPVRIEGLIAGTSRTVNLAQYLDSPLTAPKCSVQGSQVLSGTGVSASASGCQLTVTASDKARGDASIAVQVIDAPGRPAALGEVSVSVRSKPDATAAPVAVADRILGSSARVDFRPPAYDGGLPIQGYEVTAIGPGGGAKACSSSPCTITGLTNGQDYSFTVRSRNPVGWSDQSPPSNTVRPDTKPKATSISDVTPGDRKLTVSWTEPPNEGSKVLKYRVQWVNIGGNAGATGQADVPAPALTKVVTGLINDDAYNIRVQAYNEAGWGPFGPDVKAQSFGKPAAVPAPTLSPRSPVPGETNAQVSISWPSTDPNGPAITKYDVFRRTGGGAWNLIATRSGGDSRVASDTVPYQGQTVDYVVTATNGGPATSDKTNYRSYTANGYPDKPAITRAVTPRDDKTADISYTVGAAHAGGGQRVTYSTSSGGRGSFSCASGSCTQTTGALPVGSQTITVTTCNSANLCQTSGGASISPYGSTQGVPNLHVSNKDGNSITFSWGTTASNGRPITGYEIDGDRNQTVGAGTHSTTFNNLGYSQTKTIRVRAIAQDSGPGPWTAKVSGTTDPKPPPPALSITVQRGGQCAPTCTPAQGCTSQNCQWVTYTLGNFVAPISCSVSGWSNPDDGTGGSHEPTNGFNQSHKFYGFPQGSVTVTCRGADGRQKGDTKNPWGG